MKEQRQKQRNREKQRENQKEKQTERETDRETDTKIDATCTVLVRVSQNWKYGRGAYTVIAVGNHNSSVKLTVLSTGTCTVGTAVLVLVREYSGQSGSTVRRTSPVRMNTST